MVATGPDPGALLALARQAATRAGEHLLASWGDLDAATDVEAKSGPTDVVTRLDVEAERLVRDLLRRERPHDAVLGEEGGAARGTSGVRWVVDPLDGTVNYLYRLPTWAVSVAAEVRGVVEVGAVAVPALGRSYWATRGGGAFRDGAPVRPSACRELPLALLATGFAYDRATRAEQARVLAGLLGSVRDVRRLGAAALDLCLLADGSVDVYYERGLNLWDHAAGALVAREAGAVVAVEGDLVWGAAPGVAEGFRRRLVTAGG